MWREIRACLLSLRCKNITQNIADKIRRWKRCAALVHLEKLVSVRTCNNDKIKCTLNSFKFSSSWVIFASKFSFSSSVAFSSETVSCRQLVKRLQHFSSLSYLKQVTHLLLLRQLDRVTYVLSESWDRFHKRNQHQCLTNSLFIIFVQQFKEPSRSEVNVNNKSLKVTVGQGHLVDYGTCKLLFVCIVSMSPHLILTFNADTNLEISASVTQGHYNGTIR